MRQFPESVSAEHLFDAHMTLAPAERIGSGPYGTRSVHAITGGTFDGARLRGTYRPTGGDWLLSFVAGWNELDVRATMETDHGALIQMSYRGVLRIDEATTRRVMSGEDVDPAAYYFLTTPRFETGHKAYDWLNSVVSVGYGYFGPGKVGYRVFQIR